jgi:hypothetical protein
VFANGIIAPVEAVQRANRKDPRSRGEPASRGDEAQLAHAASPVCLNLENTIARLLPDVTATLRRRYSVTKRGLASLLLAPAVFLTAVLVGWGLLYPDRADPKNIKYVLWKAGLWSLDLPTATGTMVGDSDRERLVVGKTRAQLARRFGSLLKPEAASSYLGRCYRESSWNGRDVLFIANSEWMVVFDGDRATELVLIKGC